MNSEKQSYLDDLSEADLRSLFLAAVRRRPFDVIETRAGVEIPDFFADCLPIEHRAWNRSSAYFSELINRGHISPYDEKAWHASRSISIGTHLFRSPRPHDWLKGAGMIFAGLHFAIDETVMPLGVNRPTRASIGYRLYTLVLALTPTSGK